MASRIFLLLVIEFPSKIVFFFNSAPNAFRLLGNARASRISLAAWLSIADLQPRPRRQLSASRGEMFKGLPAFRCLGFDAGWSSIPPRLHEGLERMELALQIAAQLTRFARQALLQLLETAIVITHLRAEKNVPDAIDITAFVDRSVLLAVGHLGIFSFHGVTPCIGRLRCGNVLRHVNQIFTQLATILRGSRRPSVDAICQPSLPNLNLGLSRFAKK
jgi:hypothetical protein